MGVLVREPSSFTSMPGYRSDSLLQFSSVIFSIWGPFLTGGVVSSLLLASKSFFLSSSFNCFISSSCSLCCSAIFFLMVSRLSFILVSSCEVSLFLLLLWCSFILSSGWLSSELSLLLLLFLLSLLLDFFFFGGVSGTVKVASVSSVSP